ncbi:adenylate cyclase [Sinorhizobium fredii USDA 205]|uniref:Tetratricopeptide repeat protein n=3 Tax=Rhizobium fredii TaxID=380 RepID=A0A844A9C9_RHIFR|nr:BTAD domain-containing putative transcriptional regulator [Sinorhizobium fredii]AWM25499.1 Adenylate cyclase [Sinorhizobium fredii CCBAU 25509]KSV90937.1 adenylate cyclase [Sinorhizobium fredii USDA 205]MQW99454.1 tetratricopeptide repeat protein [Sinorhizobium fredii]MQX08672.1 tetratricopeptide repeat protein [Sinorhizobium fredii]UTY49668.1 tetratricopeptide repeat protein [Sinorhizobium fredii]
MNEEPRFLESVHASRVDFTLLGGFAVRSGNGEALILPTAKVRLLAAYLALAAGQYQARSKLCALFWEDRGADQARASLRNALASIRAVLGDHMLIANRDAVMLDPNFVFTDVSELEALVTRSAATAGAETARRLSAEFLEGLAVSGEELSEWIEFERTRCRNLSETLLAKTAEQLAENGEEAAAIALAQQLVALDPYREKSHRLLMRLYARQGERSLAVAQFQKCRQLLADELGTEPSPQTVALAGELSLQRTPGREVRSPDTASVLMQQEATRAAEADFRISIAVLPFLHPTEDADQSFLAEGFAEDLITELSRHKDFLVIARQSSFALGAGPRLAEHAAQALDVRYVLTGNLRRRGDDLSLGVQLIDTATHRTVWAERYARKLDEIFAVQDEIVGLIITAVDAEMRSSERERALRKLPEALDAWELFHRGLWHIYNFSMDEIDAAEECFRRATELQPRFALGHAGLAQAAVVRIVWQMSDNIPVTLESGLAHARYAVALDGAHPYPHVMLGRLLTCQGELGLAHDHLRIATELNPSYAHAHYALAQVHIWSGQPAEALPYIDRAIRFSPRDPLISMFMTVRSVCLFLIGDISGAEAAARAAIGRQARECWSRLGLAAALVESGRTDEAMAAVAEAKALMPNLSIANLDNLIGRMASAPRQRIIDVLKRAGLE